MSNQSHTPVDLYETKVDRMQNEIFKVYLRETERELEMERKKNPTILLPLPQGVVPIQPETPKVPQVETQDQPESSRGIKEIITEDVPYWLNKGAEIGTAIIVAIDTMEKLGKKISKLSKKKKKKAIRSLSSSSLRLLCTDHHLEDVFIVLYKDVYKMMI